MSQCLGINQWFLQTSEENGNSRGTYSNRRKEQGVGMDREEAPDLQGDPRRLFPTSPEQSTFQGEKSCGPLRPWWEKQ